MGRFMDHREIEERNIPDLYLMNKLSGEMRLRFEDHFVSCPECLNRLESTEDLRAALKSNLTSSFRGAEVQRPSAFFRRFAFASAVAVFLIATGLAATFALRWSEERRQLLEVRTRLAEATAILEKERNKNAQLSNEIAALTEQQVNVPVFPLVVTRSGLDSSASPTNRIQLPRSPSWLILSLELPDVPAIDTYKATVRDSQGRALLDFASLKSNSKDNLAVSVISSIFTQGDYVISLTGLKAGQSIPLGSYSFRVVR